MYDFVPKKIFFTKGVGTHRDELHSFERALRDAGIEKCNLVQVSSIFPPGCKSISKIQGLKELISVRQLPTGTFLPPLTLYILMNLHWL